ncbi:MAG: ATP-binding protein [Thalassobaculum sp.]|uniref:sensor histidine kinase n=1 Tax=Thalassobaculum sp. TaxID=2022740 RepID=UPI0032EBD513
MSPIGDSLPVEGIFDALASIDVAVAIYDRNDCVVAVSPYYRSMFPEEELTVGLSYRDALQRFAQRHDRVRVLGYPDMESYLDAEIKRHRTPYAHQVYKLASGRWIESRKVPLPDGGIVGLWRDITVQKDAEAAMLRSKEASDLASRAKADFLALMSHELRTPLNAVIGFAQLLERSSGTMPVETMGEYAGLIRSSGEQLLQTINDILDLTRLAGNGANIPMALVQLDAVTATCMRIAEPFARPRQVTLLDEVPEGLPPLRADAASLRRMITHLMSNAVKMSLAGSRVSLTAERLPDGGLAVVVADDGPGMTPAQIQAAMQPFTQNDEVRSRRMSGAGIGLPLIKTLIELHGGRLVLDSAPGRGTRARLEFPPATVAN